MLEKIARVRHNDPALLASFCFLTHINIQLAFTRGYPLLFLLVDETLPFLRHGRAVVMMASLSFASSSKLCSGRRMYGRCFGVASSHSFNLASTSVRLPVDFPPGTFSYALTVASQSSSLSYVVLNDATAVSSDSRRETIISTRVDSSSLPWASVKSLSAHLSPRYCFKIRQSFRVIPMVVDRSLSVKRLRKARKRSVVDDVQARIRRRNQSG